MLLALAQLRPVNKYIVIRYCLLANICRTHLIETTLLNYRSSHPSSILYLANKMLQVTINAFKTFVKWNEGMKVWNKADETTRGLPYIRIWRKNRQLRLLVCIGQHFIVHVLITCAADIGLSSLAILLHDVSMVG